MRISEVLVVLSIISFERHLNVVVSSLKAPKSGEGKLYSED
jgi:hypothetical protein